MKQLSQFQLIQYYKLMKVQNNSIICIIKLKLLKENFEMSVYRNNFTFRAPQSFITLQKGESLKECIKATNNSISILDEQGRIIQEVFTDAKLFPPNLSNEQINQRSMLNNVDQFLKGFNLSVFYIGASLSGKQKLFDGNKQQNCMAFHFLDYVIPQFQKKFRKLQVRMKMVILIKQKIYDCLSQNRYTIVKAVQNAWEGIQMTNATSVLIQSSQDFLSQIRNGIKQKNKLILEYKELYTSYLTLDFIHEIDGGKISVISRLNIFQIPGVEGLADSHNTVKIKQSAAAIKSLLNFTAMLSEYGRDSQFSPFYQNSVLTTLTKQILCSNSLINVFFTFKVQDIDGSLATLKYIKPFSSLKQYPIVNQSNSFGLLRKYRAQSKKNINPDNNTEKQFVQNEMIRIQTEEDYGRLMQKYTQLKSKYNSALKAKSEAQLQLLKCQQQKLQIGKSLVQIQIQNTKLLQKLQNKDYENGKKMLNAQNKLAQKEMNHQQMMQKIQQLNESLNQALQTKRDLQVQFIALKRNFILNQKQMTKLKQDNQNLSLDVINITNNNQKLKKQFLNSNINQQRSALTKSRLVEEMEKQKMDQLKRQNKVQQQTIQYLKSEVQRYKKQFIQNQVNFQTNAGYSQAKGKNYQRIQLQNENMELINRLKLKQRKIDELQQKLGFYEEENQALQNQNRRLKIKDHDDTQQYRKKLEELTKGTNMEQVVKELKHNFVKKDTQNLDKINSFTRDVQQRKRQIAQLKAYIRQLIALLQQWSPKGAEIPQIKKYMNMDFTDEKGGSAEQLRIKNRRLQQQIRRLKQFQNKTSNIKQSRVVQQYNYLKGSSSNEIVQKLKAQKNSLAQQNRRLTILLKDGNKMDLNIIKKQNQTLRSQLQSLKINSNISPISPSTNDQKVMFYEKHIKKLEKERSQLLSRCVVAEEQVKNLLGKIGGSKIKN